jgi:hypothetical protein
VTARTRAQRTSHINNRAHKAAGCPSTPYRHTTEISQGELFTEDEKLKLWHFHAKGCVSILTFHETNGPFISTVGGTAFLTCALHGLKPVICSDWELILRWCSFIAKGNRPLERSRPKWEDNIMIKR